MNERKREGRMRSRIPKTPQAESYKRYLIVPYRDGSGYFVEKDGFTIMRFVKTIEEAKATIDLLA